MAASGKIRLFLKEKACNVKKSVVYLSLIHICSNNPQNVVTATMEGLKSLRDAAQVAAVRGKAVEEL